MSKIVAKRKLPTLDEIIGLDKYKLTYSQRCDCVTLFNIYGVEAAIEHAKKFQEKS
jgi:hypothetical protein